MNVCVVTSGHLATCPRMLKAADALDAMRYNVRVISTRSTDWATAADSELRKLRHWRWKAVDFHAQSGRRIYLLSGMRHRAARLLARTVGVKAGPLWLLVCAYARVHRELVAEIWREPCDLVYGGTSGALAAVALAARRARIPYALDLEDFYSAVQEDSPAARSVHQLAERIEREILPGACFLTAGSAAIAQAYREKYGVEPVTINNTFPLPSQAPDISVSDGCGLKLYWFSQTIGRGRGLEDVVRALGMAGVRGELHLRGKADESYLGELYRLAGACAPSLTMVVHAPAEPDSMVDLCRGYDVGLCVEQSQVLNRAIALSNKAFTYMLGGLALVLTDTAGQRALAGDLGSDAIVYAPGDVAALAAGLRMWTTDRKRLRRAKAAAWQAAQRRWHWEHAEERGALLRAVERAIGPPSATKSGQSRPGMDES